MSEAPGAVDFKEAFCAVPLRETHPDASRAWPAQCTQKRRGFSCLRRQAGPGETDKGSSKTGSLLDEDHNPSKNRRRNRDRLSDFQSSSPV